MNQHLINHNSSILEALRMLNNLSGRVMTLFVVDDSGVMTGSVTDGDIRRAILRGVSVDDAVSAVANTAFKALLPDEDNVERLRLYRQSGLKLIPRLDENGHIIEIVDTTVTQSILPLSAILMAGGKGERLRPLTQKTPKPLLKIGGKPIIDYNIEALARAGVKDISVTINYLADMLEAHFSEPVAGVKVRCVKEDRPLGTIGSASLVELPKEGATIVMNSDLLTTISFEDMYLHHKANNAKITIAVVPYNVSVPYAILSTENELVTDLQEKPSYSYYANAGIYIISNELLASLSPDCRTDATDLIQDAIASGQRVSYFPISGTWIDIGSPVDYAHACELMKHHLNSFH